MAGPVGRDQDAVVDVDDDQFFALRQATALSVPWAIDSVAPGLIAVAER